VLFCFVGVTFCRCDKCGGKGKISRSVCTKCRGSKVQTGEQLLTIFIEKGMPDGHEIISTSDADENPGIMIISYLFLFFCLFVTSDADENPGINFLCLYLLYFRLYLIILCK
jgi:DnaJ-class molecular chaperone